MKGVYLFGELMILGASLWLSGCQPQVARVPRADWANRTLEETGIGRIPAPTWSPEERLEAVHRAKADAYARLEYQIMHLETEPGKTVLQRVERDDALRSRVSAFVRGAQIIKMENQPIGIGLTARLYLGEGFKALLGLARHKADTLKPAPHSLSH
jgi:hypothetical protein